MGLAPRCSLVWLSGDRSSGLDFGDAISGMPGVLAATPFAAMTRASFRSEPDLILDSNVGRRSDARSSPTTDSGPSPDLHVPACEENKDTAGDGGNGISAGGRE